MQILIPCTLVRREFSDISSDLGQFRMRPCLERAYRDLGISSASKLASRTKSPHLRCFAMIHTHRNHLEFTSRAFSSSLSTGYAERILGSCRIDAILRCDQNNRPLCRLRNCSGSHLRAEKVRIFSQTPQTAGRTV